jgi:hypothetical protein
VRAQRRVGGQSNRPFVDNCHSRVVAIMRRGTISAVVLLLTSALLRNANAFPLSSGDQTVLPPGTELNEESLDRPREVFHSEAIGGAKSYLVNLGDLAFNSNNILGDPARRAGISSRRKRPSSSPSTRRAATGIRGSFSRSTSSVTARACRS